MVKAILGIDGGGTKTHAVLVDFEGNILSTAANGGANWERIGLDAVQKSLGELINNVIAQSKINRDEIVASTFALAGIDWFEDETLFEPVVESLGLSGRCSLVNDSIAALFAGAPSGVGCVSIAGTGGKTAGGDGVKTLQTMGMELGEGGGAGQLVDLALDSIARAHHGSLPKSDMYWRLPKAAGFDDPEVFFIAIARERVRVDETLAPLIFELANTGDIAAQNVVFRVASQHALDVSAIASQLDFHDETVSVICAGGLHTAGCELFNLTFKTETTRLLGNVTIKTLDIAPVFGAVIHSAHKYFEVLPSVFLENLLSAARNVEL